MSFKDLGKNIFFQSAQNYESYLKLLRALVLILNDENPEIRLFMVHQNLGLLINFETNLKSVQGLTITDVNEQLILEQIFEASCN